MAAARHAQRSPTADEQTVTHAGCCRRRRPWAGSWQLDPRRCVLPQMSAGSDRGKINPAERIASHAPQQRTSAVHLARRQSVVAATSSSKQYSSSRLRRGTSDHVFHIKQQSSHQATELRIKQQSGSSRLRQRTSIVYLACTKMKEGTPSSTCSSAGEKGLGRIRRMQPGLAAVPASVAEHEACSTAPCMNAAALPVSGLQMSAALPNRQARRSLWGIFLESSLHPTPASAETTAQQTHRSHKGKPAGPSAWHPCWGPAAGTLGTRSLPSAAETIWQHHWSGFRSTRSLVCGGLEGEQPCRPNQNQSCCTTTNLAAQKTSPQQHQHGLRNQCLRAPPNTPPCAGSPYQHRRSQCLWRTSPPRPAAGTSACLQGEVASAREVRQQACARTATAGQVCWHARQAFWAAGRRQAGQQAGSGLLQEQQLDRAAPTLHCTALVTARNQQKDMAPCHSHCSIFFCKNASSMASVPSMHRISKLLEMSTCERKRATGRQQDVIGCSRWATSAAGCCSQLPSCSKHTALCGSARCTQTRSSAPLQLTVRPDCDPSRQPSTRTHGPPPPPPPAADVEASPAGAPWLASVRVW